MIGLFSQCPLCVPSSDWLGKYAADEKIRRSFLWNTQHTDSEPLSDAQLRRLEEIMGEDAL